MSIFDMNIEERKRVFEDLAKATDGAVVSLRLFAKAQEDFEQRFCGKKRKVRERIGNSNFTPKKKKRKKH